MEFEKLQTASLKELFISSVEDKILSGELPIGAQLPTERELAEMMDVSRGVVNSGIAEMAHKGFLEVRPRVGTFVADYRRVGKSDIFLSIMHYNGGILPEQEIRSRLEFKILIDCFSVRKLTARAITEAEVQKLEDFVEEAYRYSCDVYARALFMGDRLTPQEQVNIAAELSLLTGFDKAWILANHLVLRGYATHVRPGYRISLYDGRIAVKAGPQGDPFGPYGGDDPLSTVVAVKLLRCYRGLLCPLLGVETEEDYVVTSPILRQWDVRTPQPVANMQEALMASNHDLRILYWAGYYDARTPIGYLR